MQQFTFTSATLNSFAWNDIVRSLDYDDGTNTGGTWYLGYYQADLVAQAPSVQAVSYSAQNWMDGQCGSCGGVNTSDTNAYKYIRKRVMLNGFYVPAASLPVSKTERC